MKLKNLALLPLIVVGLNATTATNENVTKVYIADFNRAPDAAGLKYWIDTKLELENISQSFFDQDETKKLYPTTLSKADFVNEIYKNAFNRNGDPDGITYWTNELIHGTISRGNMILAIITGAKDTPEHGKDKTTIDNKTKVGLHFVASGSDDVDAAISIMDGITDDSTTVENAKEKIDQDVADADSTVGQTYVLTSKKTNLKGEGIDNVIGTSGDDTIIGLLIPDKNNSTYNSYEGEIDGKIIYLRDSIDGKIGNDTFKLTINDDDDNTTTMIDPLGKIKNVENIILDSNSSIKISGYY
nr:DUF4214 domain-containing protein [Sulfurovaceae bacterium]